MTHLEQQAADEIVHAVLEGGPVDIPAALRTVREPVADAKIKVPHYGGYEHFERATDADPATLPIVFRWTTRTKVAE
ncbi:DUF5988 family protein [Dactylosporangium sp. NPDC051541]|uniref:DUF5988 family protein n=1 Tax=Dactylosporangium sp. NPDC051541 TaxID=3363977 RepID=UPI0037A41AB0